MFYEIARNNTGLLEGRKPVSTEAGARSIAASLANQHNDAFHAWDSDRLIDVIGPDSQ